MTFVTKSFGATDIIPIFVIEKEYTKHFLNIIQKQKHYEKEIHLHRMRLCS